MSAVCDGCPPFGAWPPRPPSQAGRGGRDLSLRFRYLLNATQAPYTALPIRSPFQMSWNKKSKAMDISSETNRRDSSLNIYKVYNIRLFHRPSRSGTHLFFVNVFVCLFVYCCYVYVFSRQKNKLVFVIYFFLFG